MHVPWVTLEPGAFEWLTGILLGRERPNSVRIHPSRGDGGIDVFDPVDSLRHGDVFQAKAFATGLTATRKRHIKESLARLVETAEVEVRDWYLVIPLNPTLEQWDWFERLAKEQSFECQWFGLDRLDGLAAKYPEVVRHVLDRDDRLEQAIADLRAMMGLGDGLRVMSPADVVEPLRALHRQLNADDPFYTYDFEVRHSPPTRDEVLGKPGVVASHVLSDRATAIVHHIYARYRMAVVDAPIPLTFVVRADRMDDDTRAQWDRAMQYGTSAELPYGSVTNLKLGLPGGLGDEASEGALWIGAAHSSITSPYHLRLQIVDQDVDVAEVVVVMGSPTRGTLGGRRVHGTDRSGTFDIELLVDPPDSQGHQEGRFQLSLRPLVGLQPAAVVEAVRFLHAWREPHSLRFAPEHGPPALQLFELTESESPVTDDLVEFIHALAEIQSKHSADLRIPDLDSLTTADYEGAITVARLLRGETIEDTWEPCTLTMQLRRDLPMGGPVQLAVSGTKRFEIGDQTVELGPLTMVLLAATLESAEPLSSEASVDRSVVVHVEPALNNTTRLLTLAPIEDVPVRPVNPE